MPELTQEIAAYEKMRAELEAHHNGQWVVFYQGNHVGTFPVFEEAAQFATKHYGSGPYLIRQVGAPSIVLPASVMYRVA